MLLKCKVKVTFNLMYDNTSLVKKNNSTMLALK